MEAAPAAGASVSAPASASSQRDASPSAASLMSTTKAPTTAKVLDVPQLDDYLVSLLLACSTSCGGTSSDGSSSSRPLSYVLQGAIEAIQRIMDVFTTTTTVATTSATTSAAHLNENSIDDDAYDNNSNSTTTVANTTATTNDNSNNNSNARINKIASSILRQIIDSAGIQHLIVQFVTIVMTQAVTPAVHALHLDVVVAPHGDAHDGQYNHDHNIKKNFRHPSHDIIMTSSKFWTLRRRILLFAVMETIVPFCYEYWIKQKALKWLSSTSSSSSTSTPSTNSAISSQQQDDNQQQRLETMIERRRVFVRKFLQTIDTIIPIVKLGLLLRTWRRSTMTSCTSSAIQSPNLAMNLSGLQFDIYSSDSSGESSSTSTTNTGASPTPTPSSTAVAIQSSLFVLYAYRRWIHNECLKLWSVMVVPLCATYSNTTMQLRRHIMAMLQNHQQQFRRRRRRRRRQEVQQGGEEERVTGWAKFMTSLRRQGEKPSSDDENGNHHKKNMMEDVTASSSLLPCPFCHRDYDKIVIPYRMETCGHVACYVCLWNFIRSHCQQYVQQKDDGRERPVPRACCPVCDEDIEYCQAAVLIN